MKICMSFLQVKRGCLSLPAGRQAVGRSGILLGSLRKDSGQAGMTNKEQVYKQALKRDCHRGMNIYVK